MDNFLYFEGSRHSLIERFIEKDIGSDIYSDYELKYRSYHVAVKVRSGFRFMVMFYDYFINEENEVVFEIKKIFSSKSRKDLETDIFRFFYTRIRLQVDQDRETINKASLEPFNIYSENFFRILTD